MTGERKAMSYNIIFLSSRHANSHTYKISIRLRGIWRAKCILSKRLKCRDQKVVMQRKHCERHHLSIIDWLNGISFKHFDNVSCVFGYFFLCVFSSFTQHFMRWFAVVGIVCVSFIFLDHETCLIRIKDEWA